MFLIVAVGDEVVRGVMYPTTRVQGWEDIGPDDVGVQKGRFVKVIAERGLAPVTTLGFHLSGELRERIAEMKDQDFLKFGL